MSYHPCMPPSSENPSAAGNQQGTVEKYDPFDPTHRSPGDWDKMMMGRNDQPVHAPHEIDNSHELRRLNEWLSGI